MSEPMTPERLAELRSLHLRRDVPGWADLWDALLEVERLTRLQMKLLAVCDLMEGAHLPSAESGDLPGIRTDAIRAALASGDEDQP